MNGCDRCAPLVAELRGEITQLRREATGRRARIVNLEAKLAEARGEVGVDPLAPLVHEAGAYWRERCGHPKAKMDGKRYRAVRARLLEADSPREGLEHIKRGVDGAAAAPNVNERTGERYDDLELICRSAVKLDSFVKRAPAVGGLSLEQKLIGPA